MCLINKQILICLVWYLQMDNDGVVPEKNDALPKNRVIAKYRG